MTHPEFNFGRVGGRWASQSKLVARRKGERGELVGAGVGGPGDVDQIYASGGRRKDDVVGSGFLEPRSKPKGLLRLDGVLHDRNHRSER